MFPAGRLDRMREYGAELGMTPRHIDEGLRVVPAIPRDSLHILDTLLNLDAGVKPEMVATDNASYSDIVFGLFSLLGYNFPRASVTWPTSGSGARRCPASRLAATGRWKPSRVTG